MQPLPLWRAPVLGWGSRKEVAVSADGCCMPPASALHTSCEAAAEGDAWPAHQQPSTRDARERLSSGQRRTRSLPVCISSAVTELRQPGCVAQFTCNGRMPNDRVMRRCRRVRLMRANTHTHLCTPPRCACLAAPPLHHYCRPAVWWPPADLLSSETL